MHGGHSMKRQRGRGRKPGGGGHYNNNPNNNYQHNQPNRTMESSGPEVKVRGPASHIHERYLQLARDATAAGDRVLGENYLQHADHYFRVLRAMQPATPPPQPQAERFSGDQEFGDEGGPENEDGGDTAQAASSDDEQPEGQAPQGQQERDADFRRGRGRRSRFRPGGESADAGGGERPEQRAEQPEQRQDQRRERQPREERTPREPEGPEGFSNGPKPAFLRND